MKIRLSAWAVGSLGIVWAASACTLASPTHIDVQPSADTGDDDGGTSTPQSAAAAATSASGGSCSGTPVKADLSKLTACGTSGKAHCYDKDKMPSGAGEYFTACPGSSTQVCMQDEILEAAGGKLKSCTSIAGPGGCVDISLVNVPAQFKSEISLLKQDVCDAGQVCTPCNDPTNGNAPTPICQPIGVFDKACTGGGPTTGDGGTTTTTPGAGCCTENGQNKGMCISGSAIPQSFADQVSADTCTGGDMCVPTAFLSGKPPTCSGLLGSGVCMDKCFSSMLSIAGDIGFGQDDGCGDTEVCLPCFLLSGKGVPGCN